MPERHSFERILFTPPQGERVLPAGRVLGPEMTMLAAWLFLVIIPVVLYLICGWRVVYSLAADYPLAGSVSQTPPFRLLMAGFILSFCFGLFQLLRLGMLLVELRRRIAGSDLLLRLLSDDNYPPVEDYASGYLARLDHIHLNLATGFGRARAAGMQLPYLLELRRRPGAATAISTIALAPLMILSALNLLLHDAQSIASFTPLGMLILSTPLWQWGFANLLEITLGTGVLREHVRLRDREEREARL
ncbi:MAG: hypothetical protein H7A35_07030 [Planctomycetales bacterium]|nr:hypothetical protein [bacterium]UNM09806.1 MAG: hypothetical protein H7A35_07030 [Planctomycetales bacterium]